MKSTDAYTKSSSDETEEIVLNEVSMISFHLSVSGDSHLLGITCDSFRSGILNDL